MNTKPKNKNSSTFKDDFLNLSSKVKALRLYITGCCLKFNVRTVMSSSSQSRLFHVATITVWAARKATTKNVANAKASLKYKPFTEMS